MKEKLDKILPVGTAKSDSCITSTINLMTRTYMDKKWGFYLTAQNIINMSMAEAKRFEELKRQVKIHYEMSVPKSHMRTIKNCQFDGYVISTIRGSSIDELREEIK